MLLNYGFQHLNLNRIELQVFADNKRAIAMYEKVGFQQMGRRRNAIFRNATYHDELIMDYLRDEWKTATTLG